MPFPISEIPHFDFDAFTFIQLILTPICTIISFAFTVPLVLKRIVEEKQQGVKVSLKLFNFFFNLLTLLGIDENDGPTKLATLVRMVLHHHSHHYYHHHCDGHGYLFD